MQPHEIKAFRKSKGLTQTELGVLCGVHKGTVSSWEKGKMTPSGPSQKLLTDLISGETSVIQLSDQEARLLDENVSRGQFSDREDFLTASLVHLIKHGTFVSPEKLREETGGQPLNILAEKRPAQLKSLQDPAPSGEREAN